jgi:hypothetical protein
MGKEYVCELRGKTYDRLLIDWPGYCSATCANFSEALAAVDAKASRPTPGNGRSHGQESDGE